MCKIKFGLYFNMLLWISASCGSGGQPSDFTGSQPPSLSEPTGSGSIPPTFEPNDGQTDKQVLFLSKVNGYNMYLTGSEVVFDVVVQEPSVDESLIIAPNAIVTKPGESAAVKFTFIGASDKITAEASNITEGVSNYLIGNDPAKWITGVKNYQQVLVKNIYEKIDMKFYGAGNAVEHDFIIHPGGKPEKIQMQVVGGLGLSLNATSGDLEVQVSNTGVKLTVKKPVAYQGTSPVSAEFFLNGNTVSFSIGSYDSTRDLIIDPVTLVYSSYLGGSLDELTWGIDVDSSGNSYTVGYTKSTNFPTASAFQGTTGGGNFDAFITKLNSTGSALVYSTYLGGSGDDLANCIKVDASGNVYITGYTTSTNFPTASAFQAANAGGYDAFLTKLNSAGSALNYSTYYGGTDFDRGAQLSFDASGNIYLIGTTLSTGLSTAGVTQTTNSGSGDAFIATFNSSGSRTAMTYLGGTGRDLGTGIAIDSTPNIYITGETRSSDFPLTSALDSSLGGTQDAFIAKLNSSLTTRSYSTYFGGSSSDGSAGIGLDVTSSGCSTTAACAVITGTTSSTDLSTALANDATHNGGKDAYVTKFNSAGSAVVYSTYLGGSGDDEALGFQSIFLDANGEPWITGKTNSTQATFPIFQANIATYPGSGSSVFVAKFASGTTAADLSFVTYHGGSTSGKNDIGIGIVVDSTASSCYITGVAETTDFTTAGTPYDSTANGAKDGFVAKFTTLPITLVSPNGTSSSTATSGTTLSVTIPTGTAVDDLMVLAYIVSNNATTINTAPTGWTLVTNSATNGDGGNANDVNLYLYYRKYQAGDANPSATFSATIGGAVGIIASFRNVNPSTPTDGTATTGTSGATATSSLSAPAITTNLRNSMVISAYAMTTQGLTFTTNPSNMTQAATATVNATGNNNDLTLIIQAGLNAAGGSFTPGTATSSATTFASYITMALSER